MVRSDVQSDARSSRCGEHGSQNSIFDTKTVLVGQHGLHCLGIFRPRLSSTVLLLEKRRGARTVRNTGHFYEMSAMLVVDFEKRRGVMMSQLSELQPRGIVKTLSDRRTVSKVLPSPGFRTTEPRKRR